PPRGRPAGRGRPAHRSRGSRRDRPRELRAARRLPAQRRPARLQRHALGAPLARPRGVPFPRGANALTARAMSQTETLYAAFAAKIDAALAALERDGVLPPGAPRGAVSVEPPRDPSHGDLATNAAMVLAKRAGTNPRALAEQI